MRKVLTILGVLVLVGFLTFPVFAHRSGGGKTYGGSGAGPCGSAWVDLPDSQRAELDKLHQQFVDDTAKMREEIWNKSAELDKLLDSANPDPKTAKALQREISDLKAKMSEKRVDFMLQARKIAPNATFGRGYARGCGRDYHHGYGHHGEYGHHGPRGGYGSGPCCN